MKSFLKTTTSPFTSNPLIISLVLFFSVASCSNPQIKVPTLTLDSRYPQIKEITALAHCQSPQGSYTTEVKSSSDGHFFFTQVYDHDSPAFFAKITPGHQGYILDDLGAIVDTLSFPAIEMIKSHDFQRLHSNPGHFFKDISWQIKLNAELDLYSAVDNLNNPVKLYYNREKQHISKLELLNPLDTLQVIEIVHKTWMESPYGKMIKSMEIIQASKDTFYFNFEQIKIND